MNTISFNKEQIETVFHEAEIKLISKENINLIKYTSYDITTFDQNNKELLKSIAGKSIVYCIWVGESINNIQPKYIGHVHQKISRQRMRAHLTKKNLATGAQLENIKQELLKKNAIGLTFVVIDPIYMRKALEEWLIDKHSRNLVWNKSGKAKLEAIVNDINI